MYDKIKIGEDGENLAAEFLKEKGYEIVARNYRYKHAEIDIIAKRDKWLLFVEVKTRTSVKYGHPEEFIGMLKGRKMFEAAEAYIFATDWQGHVRFDVVAVKMGKDPEVVHFEDAIN
jgi:putative endonuclease